MSYDQWQEIPEEDEGNEPVAESGEGTDGNERVVADATGQAERTLSVLRGERELRGHTPVLPADSGACAEVAESSWSKAIVQLRRIRRLFVPVSVAEAEDHAKLLYVIVRIVSHVEEPDAGNPPVRFREGH